MTGLDTILGRDVTTAALILGLAILFYPLIKALANILHERISPRQKSNTELYEKFDALQNNDLSHLATTLGRVENKLVMNQTSQERIERILERMSETLTRIDIKMK